MLVWNVYMIAKVRLKNNTLHDEHPFEKNHTSKQATQHTLQTIQRLF